MIKYSDHTVAYSDPKVTYIDPTQLLLPLSLPTWPIFGLNPWTNETYGGGVGRQSNFR